MKQITFNGYAKFLASAFLVAAVSLALLPLGSKAQTAPAPTPPGVTFEKRLEQRKNERKVTLNEDDTERLVESCVEGQGKIVSLQQKNNTATANRNKEYQQLDAKLWVTIGKLKLANKDTFEFEKQRLVLLDKTNAFKATGQQYQQVIDDLLLVNCKADVVGFKALLETAKLYRTQLRGQMSDIKNHVANVTKPAIGSYVEQLRPKPSERSQE